MDDMVALHNTEAEGGRPHYSEEGDYHDVYTRKKFLPETVMGRRVWVVRAEGSPRSYYLCYTFIVNDMDKSGDPFVVSGSDGDSFEPEIPLDHRSGWFRELYERQNKFSLGLSSIGDRSATEFEALRTAYLASPKPIDPLPDDEEEPAPPAVPDRVWQQIQKRRGRSRFRRKLLDAYGGRCGITGCDAEPALEAAHIRPYAETGSESVTDGLLLRADIHTLFDLHLIRINPKSLKVNVAQELKKTCYGELDGCDFNSPKQKKHEPSREALRERWEQAKRHRTAT